MAKLKRSQIKAMKAKQGGRVFKVKEVKINTICESCGKRKNILLSSGICADCKRDFVDRRF